MEWLWLVVPVSAMALGVRRFNRQIVVD